SRPPAFLHFEVQNWWRLSLGLTHQIESACESRGGIISFPQNGHDGSACERATVELIYQGHVAPLRNRRDRFHVGWFSDPLKLRTNVVATSIMRECCGNVLLTPQQLSNEVVAEGIAALKGTKIT